MIRIANCTRDEFVRRCQRNSVICFCAGQKLLELCEKFHFTDNILYLVDNYKAGQKLEIEGKIIPVRAVNEIGGEAQEAALVIASFRYADEILRQLDAMPDMDGLLFFCPFLLTMREEHFAIDALKIPIIPKTIHYCWFGGKEMPGWFQENIRSWERCCPDYEIIKWDENNYDISKNRYMKQAYKKKMWAFASDYARIDIINEYGGIYLDTDVEVIRSFDSLLGYKMFCGFQNEDEIDFGLGFGSVAHHPVLEDLIQLYEEISFIQDDGTLNMVLCPEYQTRILKQYGLSGDNISQEKEEFIALSTEYFSPFHSLGTGWITENTYSVHQWMGTWNEKDVNQRNIEKRKFIMRRLERI